MLKIIVNNKEVDLGNLQSISLRYNGGLFEFNKLTGSYSIPFSLPLSDVNRPIFDFPYRYENVDTDIRQYECQIWHSGINMANGTISAKQFDNKTISCNVEIDNGNLYKKLNAKLLHEHDYGGAKPFELKEEYSVDDDDYLLYAAENYNFCDDTAWEDYWKTPTGLLRSQQNQFVDDGVAYRAFYYYAYDASAITPFPLLWRVLAYLFTNLGFLYTDNFFDNGDLKTLNIFNVNNALKSEYYDDSGQTKTKNTITEVDIANHLPEMPTGDFIKSIQNFFNIYFLSTNFSVKVIDRKEMVLSKNFTDISEKIAGDYKKTIISNNHNGVSFQVNRDMDDLNVNNDWYLDLNNYPAPNIGDTDTYSPKPNEIIFSEFHLYSIFINEGEYYNNSTNNWNWHNFPKYSDNWRDFDEYVKQMPWLSEMKQFKIEGLPTPVPASILYRNDQAYQYQIPKLKQKGNSYINSSKNKFSLRLMYYLGMKETQKDALNNQTASIVQPVGASYLNDKEISAKWSYQERWADFIEWYKEAAKIEYEQDIKFSASDIKNFDFSEKKKISGNLFFIKSFSVQLGRKTISPAKCKLLKSE